MSKKKVEREVRAAHRRNKKDKQHLGNDFDDFLSLNNQLGTMGLSLKQIPGAAREKKNLTDYTLLSFSSIYTKPHFGHSKFDNNTVFDSIGHLAN